MKITKRQGTFHGSQKQSIMLYERQPYKQSEWKQNFEASIERTKGRTSILEVDIHKTGKWNITRNSQGKRNSSTRLQYKTSLILWQKGFHCYLVKEKNHTVSNFWKQKGTDITTTSSMPLHPTWRRFWCFHSERWSQVDLATEPHGGASPTEQGSTLRRPVTSGVREIT